MKKFLVLCALLCLPLTTLAAESYAVLFKTQGTYQDVRDSLQFAIEGQGLKITNTNMIADMLERTGRDVGMNRKVYERGEQFEFCSAMISRRMMETDPHAMVLCPYSISVYTIPGDNHVYIAYRKPAESDDPAIRAILSELETLYNEIIKDAL